MLFRRIEEKCISCNTPNKNFNIISFFTPNIGICKAYVCKKCVKNLTAQKRKTASLDFIDNSGLIDFTINSGKRNSILENIFIIFNGEPETVWHAVRDKNTEQISLVCNYTEDIEAVNKLSLPYTIFNKLKPGKTSTNITHNINIIYNYFYSIADKTKGSNEWHYL